jgi:uncharacterized membrane protein
MKKNVVFISQAAMVAALYVVLTELANMAGLANGAIQVRLSEALTVLPYFTAAAVPGLYVGCLLSNILTGCCLMDIIGGSLATLLGAVGTYLLRGNKRKWLAPIPPIIANVAVVPFILIHGYGVPDAWWYLAVTVGAGEIITCGILGMLLLFTLNKYKNVIFRPHQK